MQRLAVYEQCDGNFIEVRPINIPEYDVVEVRQSQFDFLINPLQRRAFGCMRHLLGSIQ